MKQAQKNPEVEILEGGSRPEFFVVCEHASHYIPQEYDHLGLAQELRQSHIAWDPGAASITRLLSEKLRAPAVLGGASRLLYDCNRPPEAHDAVPQRSEIFDIPGNANLSAEARQTRIDCFYRPFETALSTQLDKYHDDIALVTIHSFTPVYKGQVRAVEIGILHDDDARLADAILQIAPAHSSMKIERNEPYSAQDGVMHTLVEHGQSRGLLNVMIEIRNDLIATREDCIPVAEMLSRLLEDALAAIRHTDRTKRVIS